METYKYVINQIAHDNIYSFYSNVSKKYSNTYSYELMLRNIEDAFNSMYKIETILYLVKLKLKKSFFKILV